MMNERFTKLAKTNRGRVTMIYPEKICKKIDV